MTAVWPNGSTTIPRVTSEYGPRPPIVTPGGTTSAFHTGIDLVGWSEIRAARAGTIVYAGYSASNGNEIKIDHGDGTFTRYFHLARFLRTGGSVAEGEVIGIMGMTGMATGVHLHFRTDWPLGTHHEPRAYMAQHINPAQTEADKARVRRNATYLNGLGLGPRSGAQEDGIPIDPPITNKTVSKYYNLVQLWAASQGIWHDSYGPPYLTNTKAAERALDAFLDNPPPPPVVKRRVTIDYGDGVNEPKVIEVDDGTQVARPSDPGKPGWTFAYWALAGTTTAFDFTTRVTSDLALEAVYDRVMHHLHVDFGDGTFDTEVAHGDLAPVPAAPERAGMTFVRWALAESPDVAFDFTTPITSDVDLIGVYEPNMHTITLVAADGTETELVLADGAVIGMLPDPGAAPGEGWTFKGWYAEGATDPFDFTAPVHDDARLTAVWTRDPVVPPTPTPGDKPKIPTTLVGILIALGGAIVVAVTAWLATLGG